LRGRRERDEYQNPRSLYFEAFKLKSDTENAILGIKLLFSPTSFK
jgi:hypothetical protein